MHTIALPPGGSASRQLEATYGSLPQAERLLRGVKPVMIAVIAQALYALAKTALKGTSTIVLAGA